MGLFKKKNESFLGIDIGAHGIKLVELRKNKGRPQVWTYGVVEENLDIHVARTTEKHVDDLIEEKTGVRPKRKKKKASKDVVIDKALLQDKRIAEYAHLLRVLMKQCRVQTRRATSSLPVSQVFHTIINFPRVDKKHVDEIVRAEVAKLLPRPIDEMQIVHQEVPDPEGETSQYVRLLVTAAPKELVAFYTAIFQKAGLQLQELETEAFALARSLVGHDNAVSMIVDIGAERTNFFIIDNGIPVTHQSIQMGGRNIDDTLSRFLGLPVDVVKSIKHDISRKASAELSTEPFRTLLDPIAKEIQYNFDLYLKQSGNQKKRPEKIILTGGSALFPPIADYLRSVFSLRVFLGDPWARTIHQDGIKDVLDEIGPRMAVSIGLALRNF